MISTISNIRLQLAYEKGTFGFTRLNHSGTNDGFLNLATAFNSLQKEKAKTVRKIIRSELIRL